MIDLSMYLAPAKVTAVQGAAGRVHVQTADGEPAWARWACAGPYEPVEGDEVLVERLVKNLEIFPLHENPLECRGNGPGHGPQRNGFASVCHTRLSLVLYG